MVREDAEKVWGVTTDSGSLGTWCCQELLENKVGRKEPTEEGQPDTVLY